MISALKWVPRGAALMNPVKYDLNEEEFNRIQSQIGSQLESIQLDITETQHLEQLDNEDTKQEEKMDIISEELDEYNMADYSDDEGLKGIPVFGSVQGLTYHDQHAADSEDPYITIRETPEEEMLELQILTTDNLLLACRTEDEVSHLEVYVYEESQDNLYVHHDIMLPSFPLCVEWMNYTVKETSDRKGNLVAIGTFDPEIEIWDLDTIDTVYPQVILGATASTTAPKKKSRARQSQAAQPDRHVAAITSLSGSADTTVKLWDLNTCKAVKSYTHHSDKICALAWNPITATLFMTASYDQTSRVCILDSRAAESVASFRIGSDIECVRWDPRRAERFFCSAEDGVVRCFDGRMGVGKVCKPLWSIHAHDSAVSAMDVSGTVDGLMVTGGSDKTVKVWDVSTEEKSCLASRDLGVGKVFSADFCMDTEFVVACAGSKGKIVLWNLYDNAGVRRAFNSQTMNREIEGEDKDRVRREIIAVDSDEEESDHEDEKEVEELTPVANMEVEE